MGTKKTTTPPPEQPYTPDRTAPGIDKLPVRYKKSDATDAQLAKAVRRETLRAVYFPDGDV